MMKRFFILFFLLISACTPSKNSLQPFHSPSAGEVNRTLNRPTSQVSLRSVLMDPKASASEKRAFFLARLLGDPVWEKRWWVEKTVRVLRGGESLTINEDLEALAQKSEDEVIDELMKDERFGNTILDFNMYFLGFKEDRVKNAIGYHENIFGYPTAIQSAKNVVDGGDYFTIFDLYTDYYYMGPLLQPRNRPDDDSTLSDSARRKARYDAGQAKILSRIDEIRNNPSMNVRDLCQNVISDQNDFTPFMGLPFTLEFRGLDFNPNGYLNLQFMCFGNAPPPATDFIPILEAIYKTNEKFFSEAFKFEPTLYQPQKLSDIQRLDVQAAGVAMPWLGLSIDQLQENRNSSTNYNRKRANYILKQFFCDDMTPIAVEAPLHTTSGPHGSETSCRACHYKLDPMAGFFRSYGVLFLDFKNFDILVFDDTAVTDRRQYEATWKAPAGSSRTYDVGYIRSVTNEADNEYGETLEDLARIMRKSPETKRCVVKKMFDYFVAPEQMVDAGYLGMLTDQMVQEAATDSSLAVKNTIRRLLKSESFKKTDMDPTQCYDFPPGGMQADAPPCRVSYLLQTNCKQCHDSTGAKGGLDLTRWITLPDGTKNFPHLNASGQQRPVYETLTEVMNRLNSTDPDERMPYKKMMTSQDRQELYLWAQGLVGP